MKHILHVDGDAFFVSCELTARPDLRGKPVVTGAERKIASAMSYEAKKLGVTRGMPIYAIRQLFPQVVVLSSNYDLYKLYAERMYSIVRRHTHIVEEYSIDECFADLSYCPEPVAVAKQIKEELYNELGITFSVGLSINKTFAKIASKRNKPNGFMVIKPQDFLNILSNLSINNIWGIGGQTAFYLSKLGIQTAADFANKNEAWVAEHCAKPYHEIWLELHGHYMHPVHCGIHAAPKSIASTETFAKKTSSKLFLKAELSRHVEKVCYKARREHLKAQKIYFFLKTDSFRYKRAEIVLVRPTAAPEVITKEVLKVFDGVYYSGNIYRACGVTISHLSDGQQVEKDLFGEYLGDQKFSDLYVSVDALTKRYGKGIIRLCSSLSPEALLSEKHSYKKRKLGIPFLGKVK